MSIYLNDRQRQWYDGLFDVTRVDHQTVKAKVVAGCPVANAVCHAKQYAERHGGLVRLEISGQIILVSANTDEIAAIKEWARAQGLTEEDIKAREHSLCVLDQGPNSKNILDMRHALDDGHGR